MFILFILMGLSTIHAAPRTIKIGAIFHVGDEGNARAFELALKTLAAEQIAPTFELESVIEWVKSSGDSFSTSLAACRLIEQGIAAIFGPENPHTRDIVSSIASRFEIPHIEYSFRRIEDSNLPQTSINVFPSSSKISDAMSDILEIMSWNQFTVVYESDDGLSRLQKALMKHNPSSLPITVRQLKPIFNKIIREPDYRPLLKEVANSTDYNVIMDVEPENLWIILKQADEVKLLRDYYNFVITRLHIPKDELLLALNNSAANITTLHIITDESLGLQTVESACLFDSVFLLSEALEALNALNGHNGQRDLTIEPQPLSCSERDKYDAGQDIVRLMKEVASEGRSTGFMKFDENGGRSFEVIFQEYKVGKVFKSGSWKDGQLSVVRTHTEREESVTKSLGQRRFKVTTKPGEPFVMEVTDDPNRGYLIENTRYEGYAFDLIEEISKELDFEYDFEIVPDKQYGVYDPVTKQWTGLFGRLISRNADLAVCDLTITQFRLSLVDFTTPFMNLGIKILFAKPQNEVPDLFSFLSPFSTDVWIYVATATLALSLSLFILARLAPTEWHSAHPCASDPEELENNFNLKNSLWLTLGSLMQQGSDILPVAPSIRMVTGMWWFFTLIMGSSYTANLAAFLTNVKMDASISNVDELAAQSKIKYGAVRGGSTAQFFESSNDPKYQKMWQTMLEARPEVFTTTNKEGVERVAKGKRTYAFLMESATLEYAVERNCNLMGVGSLLASKGYGIAVPPNSPYRTLFSRAILKLQERGTLRELQTKWWLKGSKNCTQGEPEPSSGELTMAHVGGVFLVLVLGCTGSFVIALCEFIWNIRKVAVEEKITPGEAFIAELKFTLNLWAETKPIKISRSSNASSSSASGGNGFTRAASTARSIVGSFLRLDTLGKDKETSPNNKSNNLRM